MMKVNTNGGWWCHGSLLGPSRVPSPSRASWEGRGQGFYLQEVALPPLNAIFNVHKKEKQRAGVI